MQTEKKKDHFANVTQKTIRVRSWYFSIKRYRESEKGALRNGSKNVYIYIEYDYYRFKVANQNRMASFFVVEILNCFECL